MFGKPARFVRGENFLCLDDYIILIFYDSDVVLYVMLC